MDNEDLEYIENLIALAKALPIGEVKIFETEIEILERFLQNYKKMLKENELAKQILIEKSNLADERNNLLAEIQKLKNIRREV